jgi:hypothetical protein
VIHFEFQTQKGTKRRSQLITVTELQTPEGELLVNVMHSSVFIEIRDQDDTD